MFSEYCRRKIYLPCVRTTILYIDNTKCIHSNMYYNIIIRWREKTKNTPLAPNDNLYNKQLGGVWVLNVQTLELTQTKLNRKQWRYLHYACPAACTSDRKSYPFHRCSVCLLILSRFCWWWQSRPVLLSDALRILQYTLVIHGLDY